MKHETRDRAIKRIRIRFRENSDWLAKFANLLDEFGARLGEMKTVHIGKNVRIRDVDVHARSEEVFDRFCDTLRKMDGVDVLNVTDVVLEMHRGGKIEVAARVKVESADDLAVVYTPGVASLCNKIKANPDLAFDFTSIQNSVAIVTNGTAILGLGDIGPVAGMPVMEGKALLFRLLADVNGIPILIGSKDPEVVIRTVQAIAPTFGAIKLEDIAAPECFDIETRLTELLDIPVVHDDQHGTAVVVLGALLNIAKYTYINLKRNPVGIVGLGAAGNGIFNLLKSYGIQEIYGADINPIMADRFRDQGGIPTDLSGVMQKSKIVIATTGVPGLIKPAMIQPKQVILALSNPNPEIEPDDALAAGALYAIDGKSVNNACAFPGLFKGALLARARRVNNAMKIAAAMTIAEHAMQGDLVPNILDRSVHEAVAQAVKAIALETGVVRFRKIVEAG
jgi:malate dehydrogenase (oxaloacetate-decarboxylating)